MLNVHLALKDSALMIYIKADCSSLDGSVPRIFLVCLPSKDLCYSAWLIDIRLEELSLSWYLWSICKNLWLVVFRASHDSKATAEMGPGQGRVAANHLFVAVVGRVGRCFLPALWYFFYLCTWVQRLECHVHNGLLWSETNLDGREIKKRSMTEEQCPRVTGASNISLWSL